MEKIINHNYSFKIKFPFKNEDGNSTFKYFIKQEFQNDVESNTLELDLIFLNEINGKYNQRYEWSNSENLDELIKDTKWEKAGKIIFDKSSYENFADDQLKELATRFVKALNSEIAFYYNNNKNEDDFIIFAKQQALNIGKRIFDEQAFFINFNLSKLSNRYVYNNFPVSTKDMEYIPLINSPFKNFDNKLKEFTIKPKKIDGKFYAILSTDKNEIKTEIDEAQFDVLSGKKEFLEDSEHELVKVYGSSSKFDKSKIESVLRDRFKRHYFGTIKNRFNFDKRDIVKYEFYLKTINNTTDDENTDTIGFIELDQNQIGSESKVEEAIELIDELLVKRIYEDFKNGKTYNKYEIADIVNKKMDYIFAKLK
ncbi:hypothetical protein [Mycoplasma sp. Mirounga ES2805-ORL]|uniref:hypothetical protein n=1 Tax=Mycoplasma sp. Mirounga ES2805-ORL TaxID=754514 RepID=UPI00197C121B|nr:hypothetical protein [Mycoplasma sp. Mirounga ES2805-ORL]QSF13547.1 hypothetical protein JXZ90_02635 [Mycoplasma sp. Mirounga ES2805-ORL]